MGWSACSRGWPRRFGLLLLGAVTACGSITTTTAAPPPDVAVPTCVPGMSVACACTSGAAGAQTCNAAGTYDACVCERFDAGVAPPVDAGAPVDVGSDTNSGSIPPLPPCAPRDAGGAPYVVDLAVGSIANQCARMSDGTLRCTGFDNANGELGNGTWGGYDRAAPFTVQGLCDVEQVSMGPNDGNVCTRHADGSVRCWGSNTYGVVGNGHVGDVSCYAGDPCRPVPTVVPGLTEVVDVAVGSITACAVRRDGSLWCWGDTLGFGGPERADTPVLIPSFTNVARVWALYSGWVFRLRSGEYVTSGYGANFAIPADAEIDYDGASEAGHVCYRLPDATVRCVGQNPDGKLGSGTSADLGTSVSDPVDPGLHGVRQIAVGHENSCAVLTDGTVQCWGFGDHGALGFHPPDDCVGVIGSTTCATRPGAVVGLDAVDRVFVGTWGACAIRADHSVWCWGTLAPTHDSPMAMPVVW